jgi:uncharacterized caspase-like protein
MRFGVMAVCGLLMAPFMYSPAVAEKRVALVIGNGDYRHAGLLPNPRHDAEDVSVQLRAIGFETIVGVDLDQHGMQDRVIAFARAVRDADVALFYYAGHAMQFGGVNYLMPTDVKLTDEADLRRMTRVDEIVEDIRQAKSLRVLVLDACRDNPLAEQFKRSIGKTRAVQSPQGLARIESSQGMIVAFATQAGRTAADGTDRNSPYSTAFLKHINAQEEIGTIFRRISDDVYAATGRSQLPEISISVVGEFYLRGRVEQRAQPTPSDAPGSALGEAAQAWAATRETTSPAVLEAFVRRFGDTVYGDMARARLDEVRKEAILAPARSPAAEPGPPSAAARGGVHCPEEVGAHSVDAKRATVIAFRNTGSGTLQIYWIDYGGERKLYRALGPGERHVQPTYMTHPWVVVDAARNCVGLYMPEATTREYVLR